MRPGLSALFAFLAILVAVALVEAVSLGGQIGLRGSPADEIRWMESMESVRGWD